MNGIILYKSKYGATRQYARWISEETGFTLRRMGKQSRKEIAQADVVICGGSVLAYTIPVAKWITKKWNLLRNKTVILFTTSGAAPDNPELRKIFESSFAPEIAEKIQYVPLGGRMIFNNLTRFDRFLMKLGQRMEKDPAKRAAMIQDKDAVDRNGIRAILDYLGSKGSLQTIFPVLFLLSPFFYL